jgi:hypothetical protein
VFDPILFFIKVKLKWSCDDFFHYTLLLRKVININFKKINLKGKTIKKCRNGSATKNVGFFRVIFAAFFPRSLVEKFIIHFLRSHNQTSSFTPSSFFWGQFYQPNMSNFCVY